MPNFAVSRGTLTVLCSNIFRALSTLESLWPIVCGISEITYTFGMLNNSNQMQPDCQSQCSGFFEGNFYAMKMILSQFSHRTICSQDERPQAKFITNDPTPKSELCGFLQHRISDDGSVISPDDGWIGWNHEWPGRKGAPVFSFFHNFWGQKVGIIEHIMGQKCMLKDRYFSKLFFYYAQHVQ